MKIVERRERLFAMNQMNMNKERFLNLAIKVIARQATDGERAELDAMLATQPELHGEFARLETDARVAKDVLPMIDAMEATAGKFPSYARERLQTKVRQTLGRPAAKQEPDRSGAWGWRWILGLTGAFALVLFVALPFFRASGGPVIEVAMLDTVGTVRGADANESKILKQEWENSTFQNFDKTGALEIWETNWPEGNKVTAKVIYDRSAGEVRVALHGVGKPQQRTFVVGNNLATTIQEANAFIQEHTRR
jgi:hypothetical protein